jgi:L-lactate dehydrogenase complex protein LldE
VGVATVVPTCLADTLRPGLAARVVALLRRRGADATVARGVTCCGQPAYNAGFAADARRVARRTLRTLARTSGEVVVPSGSCAAMMTHHWPDLFAGTPDAADAREVAGRVVELSQWLASQEARVRAGTGPVAPVATPGTPGVVAYHGSCHLVRDLGARDDACAVLAAAGIEVRVPERADLCCGFGGTFSVKLPGVSTAMADEKLGTLAATGATTVTGCDLSCLAHLEARARAQGIELSFAHLAETVE